MSIDAQTKAEIEATARLGRNRQIVVLALPVILALTSHSLIGLVDIWLIGNLGEVALAAVGLAGFSMYAAGASMFGVNPAVQALVGREVGRGTRGAGIEVINSGLLAGAGVGLLLAILLYQWAPFIVGLLSSDPAVTDTATPYFRARAFALPAEGMIYAMEGYWFAQGLMRRVMITTLTMHLFNAALSYTLIFGKFGFPELGVLGAGIGTAAGLWLGIFVYFYLLKVFVKGPGLFRQLVTAATARQIFSLALPASTLELLVATGWTTYLSIVGRLGTDSLAVVSVVLQLTVVVLLPAHGFGIAGGSLVAWALGRGEIADARRWGWQVCVLAVTLGTLLGALLALFARPVLAFFLHDPSLIGLAIPLLYITAVTMTFDAWGSVLHHTLQTAGSSALVTLIGGIGIWLVCVPASYLAGPVLGLGLTAVWGTVVLYRITLAAGYVLAWRGDGWTHKLQSL